MAFVFDRDRFGANNIYMIKLIQQNLIKNFSLTLSRLHLLSHSAALSLNQPKGDLLLSHSLKEVLIMIEINK